MNYILIFIQQIKTRLTYCLLLICMAKGPLFSQSLEIHQIGLSDGDATLIIVIDSTRGVLFAPSRPDTTVILIDAHREYVPAPLYNYIDSILSFKLHRKILDYVVLSHIHIDHYGSMVAVLDTLLNRNNTISYVFDRINVNFINLFWTSTPSDSCYDYIFAPNLSNAANQYQTYVRNQSSVFPPRFQWVSMPVSTDLLRLKNLKNFSMICLASSGMCFQPAGNIAPFIPPYGVGYYKPRNENDLSYAFLLQFQGFRYFTGGDLGGGGTYSDGETPISTYLQNRYGPTFHVCAFKVSHHGSSHSTNNNFLTNMNPTLAIVPAALRSYSGTRLPTGYTINRLRAINDSIRYTFVPNNPADPVNNWNMLYYQDVVLSIPAPPGTGAPINMQITTRIRNIFSREFWGPPVNETITCNKPH